MKTIIGVLALLSLASGVWFCLADNFGWCISFFALSFVFGVVVSIITTEKGRKY